MLLVVYKWRHGFKKRGQWFCVDSKNAFKALSIHGGKGVKNVWRHTWTTF